MIVDTFLAQINNGSAPFRRKLRPYLLLPQKFSPASRYFLVSQSTGSRSLVCTGESMLTVYKRIFFPILRLNKNFSAPTSSLELFLNQVGVEVTVTGHGALCCTNVVPASDSHLFRLSGNNSTAFERYLCVPLFCGGIAPKDPDALPPFVL